MFVVTRTSGSTPPKVMAFDRNPAASPSLLWEFTLPHECYASPAVSRDGSRLFLGTDGGDVLCLYTATSASPRVAGSWSLPAGVTGNALHIRSHPALYDPLGTAESSHRVYFHCNDGKLRSFPTTANSPVTEYTTGNQQPSGALDGHEDVNSSAPVIDANGNIYVGTSTGKLLGFAPLTTTAFLSVDLTYSGIALEVEAPPAIGPNGWVYVGTRQYRIPSQPFAGPAHAFAIDPTLPSSVAIKWQNPVPTAAGVGQTNYGVIASPVVDRQGYVYFADFAHVLTRWNALTGVEEKTMGTPGKNCQAPTLLQEGTLLLGTSGGAGGFAILGVHTLEPSGELVTGWVFFPDPPDLGSGNIFGRFAVDADGNGFIGVELVTSPSSGSVRSGKLYKFPGNLTRLAISSWPTLQSDSRGDGRVNLADRYELIELAPFTPPQGTYPLAEVRAVEPLGGSVGYSSSYYGQTATYWSPTQARSWPGGLLVTPSVATSVHQFGMAVGYQGYSSPQPVLWQGLGTAGATKTLLDPSPATLGYASDMTLHSDGNAAIVGYGTYSGIGYALRWMQPLFLPENLGQFPGGAGQVYGISAEYRICGQCRFAGQSQMFAFYTRLPAGPALSVPAENLGTFGGTDSAAWDINDLGGVVGWARNSANRRRAFRFPDPSTFGTLSSLLHELPPLPGVIGTTYSSEAFGVSTRGHTVGYATLDNGAQRAFLYRPELEGTGDEMTNLNTLPDVAGSGWTLTRANAITDSGIIVGVGTKAGSSGTRSWILIPRIVDP